MKKYFEYPVNDEIKKKILDFYEDVNIDMHNSQTQRKTKIKRRKTMNVLASIISNYGDKYDGSFSYSKRIGIL